MWTFFAWLILIVGVLSLVYFQVTPKIWIPVVAVILLVAGMAFPLALIIILWLIWAVLAIVLVFSSARIRYITRPFLHWFRKHQPALSQVEVDVLEAGGVWWEQEFFTGHPNWQRLLSAKPAKLSEEEQAFLDNQTDTLCSMLHNWDIEQNNDMPPEAWDFIKKEGFWGLILEKEYGGREFSALGHSAVVAKVASRSVAAAITIMVPNALGPAEFLTHYGTPEQKRKYLPRLATGEDIGCFALTAPEAGSDATSIADVGVVCKGEYAGQEIIGMRLNWDKRYITLAPVATLIGLAFKMYDPEHLLGDEENIGITLALIPADTPGVEAGSRHVPLKIPFMNGPVRGKDVFVPLDFIIGGVDCRGKGWLMMMECLSLGRGVSLPALAAGVSQLCFRSSGAYAQIRQQFRRPIGQFEGVSQVLACIGGYTYLADATRLFTAAAVDQGARPAIASAIAKYQLTELGRKTVNHAMDIHAGRGIQMGPRNYLGSIYHAIPISITVEGANILTRNLIIYGQGVMRCHPYLRAELMAAENPDDSAQNKKFDKLLLSHIGFVLSRMLRSFIYGISGGKWIKVYESSLTTKYLRQMTRMSNALIFVTDITLAVVGAKLKLKEALSGRLADVLSHLYMGSAVVKLYVDEGRRAGDWPFVEWALSYCLAQIQCSFDEFFANFPSRFIAKMMQWLIFPWGRAYFPARDKINAAVAKIMQHNSDARDRMTQHCYIGNADDPVGRIEKTFQQLESVKPLLQKLQHAGIAGEQGAFAARIAAAFQAGVFNAQEYEQLQHFAELYWDALQVDEFTEDKEK